MFDKHEQFDLWSVAQRYWWPNWVAAEPWYDHRACWNITKPHQDSIYATAPRSHCVDILTLLSRNIWWLHWIPLYTRMLCQGSNKVEPSYLELHVSVGPSNCETKYDDLQSICHSFLQVVESTRRNTKNIWILNVNIHTNLLQMSRLFKNCFSALFMVFARSSVFCGAFNMLCAFVK